MPTRCLTAVRPFALVLAVLSLVAQDACMSFSPIRPENGVAGQTVRVRYAAPTLVAAPLQPQDSSFILALSVEGRFDALVGDSVQMIPRHFTLPRDVMRGNYAPARYALGDRGVLEAKHLNGGRTTLLVGGTVVVLGALLVSSLNHVPIKTQGGGLY